MPTLDTVPVNINLSVAPVQVNMTSGTQTLELSAVRLNLGIFEQGLSYGGDPTLRPDIDTLDARLTVVEAKPGFWEHDQAIASSVWTIVHPLAYRPSVHIETSAYDELEGEIDYPTPGVVVITFLTAWSGFATLT